MQKKRQLQRMRLMTVSVSPGITRRRSGKMDLKQKAIKLLKEFKGENYTFGLNVLDKVGDYAAGSGKTALLIGNDTYLKPVVEEVKKSLSARGVKIAGDRVIPEAGPNAPREDVYRLESYILHFQPDSIVVVGGGSSIDAAKAANALATLGVYNPEIDGYFGTDLITDALKKTGKKLRPLIAVQTAASSGAHLTKYANITDVAAGQKKLIVDEAVVPPRAVFDYKTTGTMPKGLTLDGALDGIAHVLEVFYGAGREKFDLLQEITLTGIELVLQYTPGVINNLRDMEGREALGLATDLGGYAIMVGGTNGAHLTSFSLVDIASHGRACGLMNPYYTVFFAPAVEKQLHLVGRVFKRAGYIGKDPAGLSGRELGVAVAEGMMAFS